MTIRVTTESGMIVEFEVEDVVNLKEGDKVKSAEVLK